MIDKQASTQALGNLESVFISNSTIASQVESRGKKKQKLQGTDRRDSKSMPLPTDNDTVMGATVKKPEPKPKLERLLTKKPFTGFGGKLIRL